MLVLRKQKCLKCIFNTAKKLLRCRRACLILLPRQHRARFQRGGKGHKGQYVGETAEIIAQRRADAVFYHVGGVQDQVEGGGDLYLLIGVAKPAR